MAKPETSHAVCEAILNVLQDDSELITYCGQIEGTTYFGIDDYLNDPGIQSRPAFVVAADPDEEFEDQDANGKLGQILQPYILAVYLTGGDNEENRTQMSQIRHITRRIIHEKDTLNGIVWDITPVRFETDEQKNESNVNYVSLGLLDTRRESA